MLKVTETDRHDKADSPFFAIFVTHLKRYQIPYKFTLYTINLDTFSSFQTFYIHS